jgi:hypothetical protein
MEDQPDMMDLIQRATAAYLGILLRTGAPCGVIGVFVNTATGDYAIGVDITHQPILGLWAERAPAWMANAVIHAHETFTQVAHVLEHIEGTHRLDLNRILAPARIASLIAQLDQTHADLTRTANSN